MTVATKTLVVLALAALGCGSDPDDTAPGDSLEFTHIYDAGGDEFSLSESELSDTFEPSILRVYLVAEGTEPVPEVGIQAIQVSLYSESGGIVLITTEEAPVEVIAVEDGKMLLAEFERPCELDLDGKSSTVSDREPGTFSASGWELSVDRSELSGTLVFDSPDSGHVKVEFTAALHEAE